MPAQTSGTQGRRVRIPVIDALAWVIADKIDQAKGTIDVKSPGYRSAVADARRKEIELGELEGRMVDTEEVRRSIMAVIVARNEIDNSLPGRIAASDPRMRQKVKEEVNRAREEFADRLTRLFRVDGGGPDSPAPAKARPVGVGRGKQKAAARKRRARAV